MVHLPWIHCAKFPHVVCRICGLADVGRVAFQPLTPMLHMLDMRPGQPAYMEQLARAFEALRKALNSLQHDYEASQLAIRKPAFIPYPLQHARQVPLQQQCCNNLNAHDGLPDAKIAFMALLCLSGTANN